MIFPAQKDRGVVVFLVWNGLGFRQRLMVSLGLIFLGLILQAISLQFLPGLPLLLAGNLLLLVSGCNNRVDFGKFDPSTQWERVPLEKLDQLIELDRRMARWDRSALDVTNVLGALLFIVLAGAMVLGALSARGALQILAFDLLVLLLPHWLTGTRRVMRQPNLIIKVKTIQGILENAEALLSRHAVQPLMLLKGDQRVPTDLKFKVEIAGASKDFLGLYGQVVLNRVQGKPYPYFYVVMVAKQGFGLGELTRNYQPPGNLVREQKPQAEVEVLVIRQRTTKTSGYHTKRPTMTQLLSEGVRLAEQVTTPAQVQS